MSNSKERRAAHRDFPDEVVSTKTRGDAAEAAAARLIVRGGRLEIVARNVVAGGVELDIIARDRVAEPALFVFIEVRSRADTRLGHPLETVDARKRKRLIRGASAWLVNAGLWEKVAVRFDVLAITKDYEQGEDTQPMRDDEFMWIEAAFDATDG